MEFLTHRPISATGRFLSLRNVSLIILIGFLGINCFPDSAIAQSKRTLIKGVILDKETKSPLPKASVLIPSLRIGAVTDSRGTFSFEAPEVTHNLEARYVGYETYTQKITLKSGETKTLKS